MADENVPKLELPPELASDYTLEIPGQESFGLVSRCTNLYQIAALLRLLTEEKAQKSVAAFGMVLASHLAPPGLYRDDTLKTLDFLIATKYMLDPVLAHSPIIASVTSSIVQEAQNYAWENTVPATEWPTQEEIQNIVLEKSQTYGDSSLWKVLILSERGSVVGEGPLEKEQLLELLDDVQRQ